MSRPTRSPHKYDINRHSLRDVILNRIEEIGTSRYRLAKSGFINSAPATVYRYLNGDCDSLGGNIEEMMRALGLRIECDNRIPGWARR